MGHTEAQKYDGPPLSMGGKSFLIVILARSHKPCFQRPHIHYEIVYHESLQNVTELGRESDDPIQCWINFAFQERTKGVSESLAKEA